jgi:hypothetical protein
MARKTSQQYDRMLLAVAKEEHVRSHGKELEVKRTDKEACASDSGAAKVREARRFNERKRKRIATVSRARYFDRRSAACLEI